MFIFQAQFDDFQAAGMMVNRPLSRFRDAFNVKIMYNNLDNVLD